MSSCCKQPLQQRFAFSLLFLPYILFIIYLEIHVQHNTIAYCLEMLLPIFVYLKYIDRVAPLTYIRLRGAQSMSGVGWGLAFGLLFILILRYRLDGWHFTAIPPRFLWSEWFSAVVAASLIEEILCCGFWYQKLAAQMRFNEAAIITCLIFVLIHLPSWTDQGLRDWALLYSACYIFVFRYVDCYIFRAAGSLWTPILLHAANNYVTFMTLGQW